MYCKDCKYFKENKWNPSLGQCESGKIKEILEEDQEECLIVFTYDPFSKIMKIVGKNYGCIHFEAI